MSTEWNAAISTQCISGAVAMGRHSILLMRLLPLQHRQNVRAGFLPQIIVSGFVQHPVSRNRFLPVDLGCVVQAEFVLTSSDTQIPELEHGRGPCLVGSHHGFQTTLHLIAIQPGKGVLPQLNDLVLHFALR